MIEWHMCYARVLHGDPYMLLGKRADGIAKCLVHFSVFSGIKIRGCENVRFSIGASAEDTLRTQVLRSG